MWLPRKGFAGGNMLLKYTLKNIFAKPGRLIIIMLCMTIASVAGFVAVDFGRTFKGAVLSIFTGINGNADFLLINASGDGITDDAFSGASDFTDIEYVSRRSLYKHEFRRTEKDYAYAFTDEIPVTVFSDFDKAVEMKQIFLDKEPGEYEIAISKKYSDKYGYKIGDTINLPDIDNEDVPFTVSEIYSEMGILSDLSGVISEESCILLKGSITYRMASVDVDDEKRDEFEDFMKKNHPTISITKAYANEDIMGMLDSITGLFYLAFVLVFVLVVFVTVSFTEKIITERMSVIGTLRSIGMSRRKTTAILLFENVLYGLVSGILGLIIYLIGRVLALDYLNKSVLSTHPGKEPVNYPMFALVILGAVLIQVLVPLLEVRKAVNTSIRDIIFETRDSEFKVSYKKTIIGALCIVVGLILGFATDNMYVMSTGVLLIIIGAALSVQFLVNKLTQSLSGIFEKNKMPVAELASKETGSKKPNSGNAVLAIASVTAAASIFVIVSSLLTTFNKSAYDADVVVEEGAQKQSKYEYIEENEDIKDIDYLCETDDQIKNDSTGEAIEIIVIELPEKDMLIKYGKLPTSLEKFELLIDRPLAHKLGVQEGEKMKLTFHSRGLFPYEGEFTIKKILDETEFGSTGSLIMSRTLYKEFYVEDISTILIKTNNPDAVKNELEESFTLGETVKTKAEVISEQKKENAKVVAILIGVMIVSVVLTLIGISGNQLIGFTARKKEYAMLHSSACSQKMLIKLILLENAFLFGISCVCAGIICVPVSYIISKIMDSIDMGLTVDIKIGTLIICIFILWLITMFTSTTPIKSLKKMNTAMELKYE